MIGIAAAEMNRWNSWGVGYLGVCSASKHERPWQDPARQVAWRDPSPERRELRFLDAQLPSKFSFLHAGLPLVLRFPMSPAAAIPLHAIVFTLFELRSQPRVPMDAASFAPAVRPASQARVLDGFRL